MRPKKRTRRSSAQEQFNDQPAIATDHGASDTEIVEDIKHDDSPGITASRSARSSSSSSSSSAVRGPRASSSTSSAGAAQPRVTFSSAVATQPRASSSTSSAGAAQTRASSSTSSAGAAQPRASSSTSSAGAAQPRASLSSSSAGAAQPRASSSTSSAGATQPRASSSSSSAGAAQPRASSSTSSAGAAQPRASSSSSSAVAAQPIASALPKLSDTDSPAWAQMLEATFREVKALAGKVSQLVKPEADAATVYKANSATLFTACKEFLYLSFPLCLSATRESEARKKFEAHMRHRYPEGLAVSQQKALLKLLFAYVVKRVSDARTDFRTQIEEMVSFMQAFKTEMANKVADPDSPTYVHDPLYWESELSSCVAGRSTHLARDFALRRFGVMSPSDAFIEIFNKELTNTESVVNAWTEVSAAFPAALVVGGDSDCSDPNPATFHTFEDVDIDME